MFMFGSAHYDSADAAVDMHLGLPYQTLSKIGCQSLDEDFTYLISVKGTAQSPEIDWLK